MNDDTCKCPNDTTWRVMENEACRYSYTHWVEWVPATGWISMTYLDPDNIILIPACSACRDFYEENRT